MLLMWRILMLGLSTADGNTSDGEGSADSYGSDGDGLMAREPVVPVLN